MKNKNISYSLFYIHAFFIKWPWLISTPSHNRSLSFSPQCVFLNFMPLIFISTFIRNRIIWVFKVSHYIEVFTLPYNTYITFSISFFVRVIRMLLPLLGHSRTFFFTKFCKLFKPFFNWQITLGRTGSKWIQNSNFKSSNSFFTLIFQLNHNAWLNNCLFTWKYDLFLQIYLCQIKHSS